MNANKIPLDIPLNTKGSNGTQSKCVMLVIGWALHISVLRQTARQWTESTAHDPHSHTPPCLPVGRKSACLSE